MSQTLFYMSDTSRRILLQSHEFCFEQAKSRLLRQFDNLEQEADRFADQWLGDMRGHFDPDQHDPGEFVEAAYEHSIEYYLLLDSMRKQTILSVVAGLFHEFEKEFRVWVARELDDFYHIKEIERKVWSLSLKALKQFFDGCGWNVTAAPFSSHLEACELIVNVHKHGKGRSLEQLKDRFPEYIDPMYRGFEKGSLAELVWKNIDHECLDVKEDWVDWVYKAISAFWQSIPERIMTDAVENEPKWLTDAMQTKIGPGQR